MKKIRSIKVKVHEDLILEYDEDSFKPNKTIFKKNKDKIEMIQFIELKNKEVLPLKDTFNISNVIEIKRA